MERHRPVSFAKLVVICYGFFFSFFFFHFFVDERYEPLSFTLHILSAWNPPWAVVISFLWFPSTEEKKKNAWIHLLAWASDEQNLQHYSPLLGSLVLRNVCWTLGTQIRSENLYITEVTFKGLSAFQFGWGTCLYGRPPSVDNVSWAGGGDLLGFIFLFFPLAQSLLCLCALWHGFCNLFPVLLIKKLRHRKVESLVQVHTASRWWSQAPGVGTMSGCHWTSLQAASVETC